MYRAHGGLAGKVLFGAAWDNLGVHIAKHALYDYFSCDACKNGPNKVAALDEEILRLIEDVKGFGEDTPVERYFV